MVRSVSLLVTLVFLLAGCLISSRPLIDQSAFPLSPGTFQAFDVEIKDRTAWLTPRTGDDGRFDTGHLEVVDGWYRHQPDSGGGPTEFKLAETEDPSIFVAMIKITGEGTEHSFVYYAIEVRQDYFISYGLMAKDFANYIQTSRWKNMPGWKIENDELVVFESLPILQKALPEMIPTVTRAVAYRSVDPAVVAAQKPATEPPDAKETPSLDLAPPEPPSPREQAEKECREGAGIPLSCKIAGDMYINGDGGPVDVMRAGQFYTWGCQAGNSESCGAAFALALIVGLGKQMDDAVAQPGRSEARSGGEEWAPSHCCHGIEGNAPPPGSRYWEGHELWCWTNYDYQHLDGTYATWCKNAAGGVWEQPYISRCAGVEGWCD